MPPPVTLEAAEKRTTTQLGLVPPCVKVIAASGIPLKVFELVETVPVIVLILILVGLQTAVAAMAGAEPVHNNKAAQSRGRTKRSDMTGGPLGSRS
jgi:hypothetical protein